MEPIEPIVEIEIDILEFAERGEEIPHAKAYRVRINGKPFRVESHDPTGEFLLGLVHERPCRYELIEEFKHCENAVVEPNEKVNLRKHGLKGFITAHKEIVTIYIGKERKPEKIERGEHTVAEILALVGKTVEGYDLLEEKDGPPLPLPESLPVKIEGCEVFHVQVKSGGSS